MPVITALLNKFLKIRNVIAPLLAPPPWRRHFCTTWWPKIATHYSLIFNKSMCKSKSLNNLLKNKAVITLFKKT